MFVFWLACGAVVSSAVDVTKTSFYKADAASACLPQDRIFDQSECQSAGQNQGYTFQKVVHATDRPAGCFWDNSGGSYLNTNGASSGTFWNGVGGLCNQDLQHFDLRLTYPGCGTEILNQGGCGSCWAFGTIEAVSDRFCVMGKHLTVSPQTLVSCPDSKGGCGGGAESNAYNYIASHGLPTCTNQCASGCEPYGSGPQTCQSGQEDVLKDRCYGPIHTCSTETQCHDGSHATFYKVRDHTKSTLDTDQEIVKAQLRTHGSVSGGLSVYQNWGGWVKNNGVDAVYDSHEGTAHVGAHAIKISGYGVSGGKKYWLVQNSWGSGFADGGYIKMLRNTTNSEENGILWDKAEWATPVVQNVFALEPDVSPAEQMSDEIRITGGWMTADHTHPDLQELAQTTLQEANAPGYFVSLAQVETQVVAGFNARFTIETSEGTLRIESRFDSNGKMLGSPAVSSLMV